MFFVRGKNLPSTKADPYFGPRPKEDTEVNTEDAKTELATENKKNKKLIFHINQVTGIQWLCIPSKATVNIIAVAHGNSHLGFNKYYETIIRLWYVQGLVKQLCLYIQHCPQYLVL